MRALVWRLSGLAANNASEADMACGGVDRLWIAGRWTVALAVVRGTKV
jgi:hypothetical protein